MEWTIVTVIVVLVGLVVTIVKPLINYNKSTVENTCAINNLTEVMKDNKAEHSKLWDKLGEHDEKISEHDTAIAVLNQKVG